MKISKILLISFCFSVGLLNAKPLPILKLSRDFGIEKMVGCNYRIRINNLGGATLSVVVGNQQIVNSIGGTQLGTGIVNISVPPGGGIATINSDNCVIYISSLANRVLYVLDYYPVINTQLVFNSNCTISD